MGKLKRRPVVVAGAALGLAATGALVPAKADVPVGATGWWTRSAIPPTVPDGGIAVGQAPDGDVSVGALKLDVGEGASGASLKLIEANSPTGVLGAIQVCRTSTTWSPAKGAPLAEAPKDECAAKSVAMVRGADGSWTADVQPLLDGSTGEVGLIVKPAPGGVPAFEATFNPPQVGGSVTEAPSSTPSGPPSAEPPAAPSSEPSAAPSGPSSLPTSSAGSITREETGSFAAPASPSVAPPAASATPTEAAGPTAAAEDTGEVPFRPQAIAPAASARDDVTRWKVLLWFAMAIVVGAVATAISWAKGNGKLNLAGMAQAAKARSGAGSLSPDGPQA